MDQTSGIEIYYNILFLPSIFGIGLFSLLVNFFQLIRRFGVLFPGRTQNTTSHFEFCWKNLDPSFHLMQILGCINALLFLFRWKRVWNEARTQLSFLKTSVVMKRVVSFSIFNCLVTIRIVLCWSAANKHRNASIFFVISVWCCSLSHLQLSHLHREIAHANEKRRKESIEPTQTLFRS